MLPAFCFHGTGSCVAHLCNKTGSQQRLLAAVRSCQLIFCRTRCDATKSIITVKSPAHKIPACKIRIIFTLIYTNNVANALLIFRKICVMKRSLLLLLVIAAMATNGQSAKNIDGHPAWIMQGNIYEVNVAPVHARGHAERLCKKP